MHDAWLLLIFALGGKPLPKRRSQPMPAPGGNPVVSPGMVLPIPTPSDAASVKTAIEGAYTALRGAPPPREESWLFPLALSSVETSAWTSLFNFNVGNVTLYAGQADPWYLNPKVTNGLKFVSYPNLVQGARGMLHVLDQHGGLVAADNADLPAFQVAATKYAGLTPPKVYPSLGALVASLAAALGTS